MVENVLVRGGNAHTWPMDSRDVTAAPVDASVFSRKIWTALSSELGSEAHLLAAMGVDWEDTDAIIDERS